MPKPSKYRSVTNILSFSQKMPNNTKIPGNKTIMVIFVPQLINVDFCSEFRATNMTKSATIFAKTSRFAMRPMKTDRLHTSSVKHIGLIMYHYITILN